MKQFTKLMAGWLSLVLLVSPLRAAEMNVVPGQVQYGGRLELAADAAQGVAALTTPQADRDQRLVAARIMWPEEIFPPLAAEC